MLRLHVPCTAAGWARIATLGGAVPASLETSEEFPFPLVEYVTVGSCLECSIDMY